MQTLILAAHGIMGFFLLLVVIAACRYLFRYYGFRGNWIRIPQPILLVLALLFCGLTGFFVLGLGPMEALLAIALGGGICVSLVHPMAAIAIFMATLLVRPWEMFEGSALMAAMPRLLAAVSIGSWLLSRFVRKKFTFVWNRPLTIFSLLYGWLILSAFISPYSNENVDFIVKTFLPIYVVCILIVNSVESYADLRLLERCLTLSLTGVIAVAIVLTVSNPKFATGEMRLEGFGLTGNSNDLAALAVLALPFLIVPTLKDFKFRKLFGIDTICILILVAGLLMTKSRAAVLAFGGACLLYLFLFSKSASRLMMWLVAALPFLAGFMLVAMQRDSSDLEGSSESRMNYILAGFRMLKDHPFLGVGTGNYPRFYERYTSVFLETGLRTAHSTWMLLLAETGPLGLILFAILFFGVVKKAWQLRKVQPELIMSCLGYGVTMSVLSHSYAFYPYFLIFLVISAYRVTDLSEENG